MLPSEISGLERLHAFLKIGNMVVPFGFPYTAPLKSQQGFIPRASSPRVIEMEKRSSEPTVLPASQETSPRGLEESPKGIAAGQEPYFE